MARTEVVRGGLYGLLLDYRPATPHLRSKSLLHLKGRRGCSERSEPEGVPSEVKLRSITTSSSKMSFYRSRRARQYVEEKRQKDRPHFYATTAQLDPNVQSGRLATDVAAIRQLLELQTTISRYHSTISQKSYTSNTNIAMLVVILASLSVASLPYSMDAEIVAKVLPFLPLHFWAFITFSLLLVFGIFALAAVLGIIDIRPYRSWIKIVCISLYRFLSKRYPIIDVEADAGFSRRVEDDDSLESCKHNQKHQLTTAASNPDTRVDVNHKQRPGDHRDTGYPGIISDDNNDEPLQDDQSAPEAASFARRPEESNQDAQHDIGTSKLIDVTSRALLWAYWKLVSHGSRQDAPQTAGGQLVSQSKPGNDNINIRQKSVKRKKKHQDNSDGEGLPEKRRLKESKANVSGPLFACPFNKFDPRLFGPDSTNDAYVVCGTFAGAHIAHLKQHLQRTHYRPRHYCSRCGLGFKTQEMIDAHLQCEPICKIVDMPLYPDRIGPRLIAHLCLDCKNPPNTKPVEYWHHVYNNLFPGATQLRPVSPYYQGPAEEQLECLRRFARSAIGNILPIAQARLNLENNIVTAQLVDEILLNVTQEYLRHIPVISDVYVGHDTGYRFQEHDRENAVSNAYPERHIPQTRESYTQQSLVQNPQGSGSAPHGAQASSYDADFFPASANSTSTDEPAGPRAAPIALASTAFDTSDSPAYLDSLANVGWGRDDQDSCPADRLTTLASSADRTLVDELSNIAFDTNTMPFWDGFMVDNLFEEWVDM